MARKRKPAEPRETSVYLIGEGELQEKFKLLGERAKAVLEDAARAGAEIIRFEANNRAPEPLIEIEMARSDELVCEIDIGPPKEKWRWQFVEIGATAHEIAARRTDRLFFGGRESDWLSKQIISHPGMAAKPFLRPAVDLREQEAADAAGEILKRAIESVCDGDD
jgi:HK97 gp10 family phage protein